MLQLRNLSKIFTEQEKFAFQNLNLEIQEGEFFSLLGPSGCGKSTLLRLISGFESPTTGDILLNGVSILALQPAKRPFNMVFQSYALFQHLSVFDNVAFGLRIRNAGDENWIKKEVFSVLASVDLEGFHNRMPQTLSGGQSQRVALARALVNKPKVLLLDEPLSALDAKMRENMRRELRALQQKTGITFIFVTHDQEEALTLSDRIAVMNKGQIEQLCSPRELYEKPKTAFVARFVGTTNELPGIWTTDRNGSEESGTDKRLKVEGFEPLSGVYSNDTSTENLDFVSNQRAIGFVRPEKIRIDSKNSKTPHLKFTSTNPEPNGWNRLQGTLINSVFRGNQIDHHVDCGDTLGVFQVSEIHRQELSMENGDEVSLFFRSEDTLIFSDFMNTDTDSEVDGDLGKGRND